MSSVYISLTSPLVLLFYKQRARYAIVFIDGYGFLGSSGLFGSTSAASPFAVSKFISFLLKDACMLQKINETTVEIQYQV